MDEDKCGGHDNALCFGGGHMKNILTYKLVFFHVSFINKSWSMKIDIFNPNFGPSSSTSVDQFLFIRKIRGSI